MNRMERGASRRLRIFLCHASEDKPIVRTLYKKLQTYNVELWFDEQDLIPGERWEQVIPDVIQKCDIVLICLSHAFLRKEGFAHYEVHVVLEAAKRKPPDTLFHIPFRLDDCDVPSYLLQWHYASNFIAGDFEKIISAFEKRREWLNTYHGANIEPLRTSSASPPDVEKIPQDNHSGEPFPEGETNTMSQRPALASSPVVPGKGNEEVPRPEQAILLRRYDMHASWVLAAAWEPGGTRIASAGADGTVRIWEADTGESLLTYHGHTRLLNKVNLQSKIYTIAWAPEGQRVASAGDGAMVHIWSAETGQTLTRYESHSGLWPGVFALAWAPNGQQIASVCSHDMGNDNTIHIWNATTGQKLASYDARYHWLPKFFVPSLAWSPDGVHLAAACGDKTIRIWNTARGDLVSTYYCHSKGITHIAWSPDNHYLASAHPDHTVHIWDISTQTKVVTCYGHEATVRHVAWSPSGTCIATAANDRTVRLWEALTGSHLYTYRGHSDWVTSVGWSPDGARLASASNDKTVHIWRYQHR